jgi:hypothetical protein
MQRCTCTHTWYKNKTCEDGSTLASTFRLLSIFTVEGLKYNCVGSTKEHHTSRPKAKWRQYHMNVQYVTGYVRLDIIKTNEPWKLVD